jgi:hypothetical protein
MNEVLTLRTARAVVQVYRPFSSSTVHVTVMLTGAHAPVYFTFDGSERSPSREDVHGEVVARMGWDANCRVEQHEGHSGGHYFLLYGN